MPPDQSSKDNTSPKRSLKGRLILASHMIQSGIFYQSVIYISNYSKTRGTKGIIINIPTENKVRDVISAPNLGGVGDLPLHVGGPIDSDKFCISQFSGKNQQLTMRIFNSIEEAAQHANEPKSKLIATVGRAQWEPGQLEDEIKEDGWFILKPNDSLLELPFLSLIHI